MKPTLLILAAGMGSRYGGLKQIDGINGVILISLEDLSKQSSLIDLLKTLLLEEDEQDKMSL